jgi:acyl carrier protein phosphodiesterase
MNFLAHAHLSFGQPGILTGNMISDFVKGKRKFEYSAVIQNGIALHRAIDEFTDFHPVTQQAKLFFRKAYRLYSGAFIDVAFDHFLANDKNEFASGTVLESFCQSTYGVLNDHRPVLPGAFLSILPYMEMHNWLYNYRLREGIEKSFAGLVRRASFLTESNTAFEIFNTHYDELSACYDDFFPQLKAFAFQRLEQMNH